MGPAFDSLDALCVQLWLEIKIPCPPSCLPKATIYVLYLDVKRKQMQADQLGTQTHILEGNANAHSLKQYKTVTIAPRGETLPLRSWLDVGHMFP